MLVLAHEHTLLTRVLSNTVNVLLLLQSFFCLEFELFFPERLANQTVGTGIQNLAMIMGRISLLKHPLLQALVNREPTGESACIPIKFPQSVPH